MRRAIKLRARARRVIESKATLSSCGRSSSRHAPLSPSRSVRRGAKNNSSARSTSSAPEQLPSTVPSSARGAARRRRGRRGGRRQAAQRRALDGVACAAAARPGERAARGRVTRSPRLSVHALCAEYSWTTRSFRSSHSNNYYFFYS